MNLPVFQPESDILPLPVLNLTVETLQSWHSFAEQLWQRAQDVNMPEHMFRRLKAAKYLCQELSKISGGDLAIDAQVRLFQLSFAILFLVEPIGLYIKPPRFLSHEYSHENRELVLDKTCYAIGGKKETFIRETNYLRKNMLRYRMDEQYYHQNIEGSLWHLLDASHQTLNFTVDIKYWDEQNTATYADLMNKIIRMRMTQNNLTFRSCIEQLVREISDEAIIITRNALEFCSHLTPCEALQIMEKMMKYIQKTLKMDIEKIHPFDLLHLHKSMTRMKAIFTEQHVAELYNIIYRNEIPALDNLRNHIVAIYPFVCYLRNVFDYEY